MKKKIPEPRPFHETIVDAINTASEGNLDTILSLIRDTIIPKNHDAIIKAIKMRTEFFNHPIAKNTIKHVLGQKALAKKKSAEENKPKPLFLQLISSNKKLIIDPTSGKAFIAKAEKTFNSYIDSGFSEDGLNTRGKATEKMVVDIYEQIKGGTSHQIFTSLDLDLDRMVMTQNQVIKFCKKYPESLQQDGNANLFLIKENKEYYVVRIYMTQDFLGADIGRLDNPCFWTIDNPRYIVVPRINRSAK